MKILIAAFLISMLLFNNSEQSKMIHDQQNNQKVRFTVVFDNISYSSELKTEWGFGCVIQTDKDTIVRST